MNRYPQLHIVDHPLIQHKLTLMRRVETRHSVFRQLLREIALLMGYEITRNIPLTSSQIETPVESMIAPVLAGREPAIIPILRAGLGMADALLQLMPEAPQGHIGLYRDPETKKPIEYLVKLPDMTDRHAIVVDPMLATGNSAVHAINILNSRGVNDDRILMLILVASPEGVETFTKAHPKIPIYTAALDEHLNDHAYIVPGLGDAGDRLFGTK